MDHFYDITAFFANIKFIVFHCFSPDIVLHVTVLYDFIIADIFSFVCDLITKIKFFLTYFFSRGILYLYIVYRRCDCEQSRA